MGEFHSFRAMMLALVAAQLGAVGAWCWLAYGSEPALNLLLGVQGLLTILAFVSIFLRQRWLLTLTMFCSAFWVIGWARFGTHDNLTTAVMMAAMGLSFMLIGLASALHLPWTLRGKTPGEPALPVVIIRWLAIGSGSTIGAILLILAQAPFPATFPVIIALVVLGLFIYLGMILINADPDEVLVGEHSNETTYSPFRPRT